ncbi:CCA tRNA nucleotidyltransferase [Paenibacillus massiliensis]|uniref:CCA tRNA nucleotidyltransferase n=1 Tax=Paenibacillus massiliensis TaxID=225917 RepID=UPI000372771C|nr:CCA tRNA nucleotidyltransferase [Paenibacillus massiliensis]
MYGWRYADPDMVSNGLKVLNTLIAAGYETYFVGGCVRDELLKRPVHDMDITTAAEPEQVLNLFPDAIPTGIQHGTVTVMLEGNPYEVTTFRTESDYKDHRRPADVAFVKEITEDLRRRDFTMNAIAMRPDGTRVDPFAGEEDIRLELVRCVGEAEQRFEEDALRMLRCVRFAANFGFSIAYNTWKALLHKRELLQHIAMERVRTEIEKLLEGPDPLRGLELLRRSGLLSYTKVPTPWEQVDPALLARLDELAPPLRWGMLAWSTRVPAEELDPVLRGWTCSNEVRERAIALLRMEASLQHGIMNAIMEQATPAVGLHRLWISLILKYGPVAAEDWLEVQRVMPTEYRELYLEARSHMELITARGQEWLSSAPVLQLKDLEITGGELAAILERRGGPWLGQLMARLLYKAACGELKNEREALIEEAKRVMNDEQA